MPTLRDIRAHISSVSHIARVTRAMEMVATARSRRLQDRVASTRLFASKSWEVLTHLTAAVGSEVSEDPIFCGRSALHRLGMVLITSDAGMVGPYNHNVISKAVAHIRSRGMPTELITIGGQGRRAMLGRGYSVYADFGPLEDLTGITAMTSVARLLLDGFRDQVFDQVVVGFTQFRPGARLKPTVRQLLPVCPAQAPEARDYIYEPDAGHLLLALLPRFIRFQVYHCFLESLAAENVSRMVAMRTATQNARDLIGDLTISYNKARQQTITSEIMDIVGGAAALGQG